MVIGIDISPACRKYKTGIEWYAWHITKGLLAQRRSDISYRLYTDVQSDSLFQGADTRILRWPTKYFWPECRLSLALIGHPPDLLFVPSRSLPLALPKKVVTTIHDVGFIPFPSERKRLSSEYLLATCRRAAHVATHIITVSEFAKADIVKYFAISPEKITVTHLGYDKERYIPQEASAQCSERPFILFVGRRERRKNLVRLVHAYERLWEYVSGVPDLVLAGPPGHHAAEIDRAIVESPARGSIVVKDWISEDEKIRLLQRAHVYVQPSLYEGFGLPVIEANACGVPVACSNAASLPEVAGEGALYFNPESVDDIAQTLRTLVVNTELRSRLVQKGLSNAQRFDWKITTSKTFEVLRDQLRQGV